MWSEPLEKEMATHSSVLAWRIPGTAEPGGLPAMGSHRVGHDWSNLAAAAEPLRINVILFTSLITCVFKIQELACKIQYTLEGQVFWSTLKMEKMRQKFCDQYLKKSSHCLSVLTPTPSSYTRESLFQPICYGGLWNVDRRYYCFVQPGMRDL